MKFIKIFTVILLFFAFSYYYLLHGSPAGDILTIRFTRYLLCIFAGFSLSMNGALLQTITQNPLAEPYLLGISGGALLGYIIGMAATFHSPFFLSIPAFIFALLGVAFVYTLSSGKNGIKAELLILSGIFINLFASSILFLSAYFLHISIEQIIYLLFGSMNVIIGAKELSFYYIALLIGFILEISLILFSREFDLLSIGPEEARVTGVHPEKIKAIVLIVSSLTTAFVVSLAGIIGFVGLLVPHITRSLTGKRHISYLPLLFFTGGFFLLVSDFIAKSLFPFELPIGSITALFGIPFFFLALIKKRHESI